MSAACSDQSISATGICYTIHFINKNHLKTVLNHPSFNKSNFERYEFLGDKVIGMVAAEWLSQNHQNINEGDLSMLHAQWVNKQTLASMGQLFRLDQIIKVRGNIKVDTILADGFEALAGAIYLDQGLEKVRELWLKTSSAVKACEVFNKTYLQEWAHKQLVTPVYDCNRIGGTDHHPNFCASVTIKANTATGVGGSKKEAENNAAIAFIKKYIK